MVTQASEARPGSALDAPAHALGHAGDDALAPSSPLGAERGRVRGFVDRNRFLLAFAGLSSLMGVSVGVAKVTTSLYAVHLGASGTLLGLIATSQSAGVLLMSLPIGFLVERFGPGRLFMLGSVLAGSVYAALPLVPAPAYLLACTVLISFCMPLRFVSLNSVFMGQLEVLGESKAGWYRGTHMLGMFLLGPGLAALLVRALDFSGTYWAIALAFWVTIGLGTTVFAPAAGERPAPRALSAGAIVRELGALMRDREVRSVSSIECLAQAANASYAFFIVVVAVEVLGLGREAASGLVAAHGLSFVFALFTLGGVVRRLGHARVYRLSFAWVAAALLLLGLARGAPLLWVGAFALGLGLGTLQIANLTRFARASARLGRGRVAGINALVGPSGAVLGSLVGGLLAERFGVQALFVVLAPLFALACLRTPRLLSEQSAPSR